MAVRQIASPIGDNNLIAVDGDRIRILGPLDLISPSAAHALEAVPPEMWLGRLTAILNAGGECMQAGDTSATMELLNERLARMLDGFDQDTLARLASVLEKDRDRGRKEFDELFGKARVDLTKAVSKYADPNLPDALPAIVEKRLADAHRAAIKGIDTMLQDGDEGVLSRYAAKIVKAVHDDIDTLRKEVIERRAIHDKGTGKGTTFEEEVIQRLQSIVTPLGGTVTYTANALGLRKTRKGDIVVEVDGPVTGSQMVRVVVEAKDWESDVSDNMIRDELRKARDNRGAQVGVFVASSADILPQGRGFGRIDGDFFLAWPRGGDATPLSVVLHLAVTQIIQELRAAASGEHALEQARRQASVVLSVLQSCDPIQSALSATIKSADKASSSFVTLRETLAEEAG